MRVYGITSLMIIAAACAGCVDPPQETTSAPEHTENLNGAQPAAEMPAADAPGQPSPALPGLPLPPTAAPQAPPPPAAERVAADVGVGQKGRSLDDEQGAVARVIVEPARTLFAFRERAVFQIQIPQAMQFFQASEGRTPQSHEEFMEKIIQAQQIRLPELPPGQRYVYDPAAQELMVERPQQ